MSGNLKRPFISRHDRKALFEEKRDRFDGLDPQIHDWRFVRRIYERFDAGAVLTPEQSALENEARAKAELDAEVEKQYRLDQLKELDDVIRLGGLSELERKVIELRYCHCEPDYARVLHIFTVRSRVFKPGENLSADELEGIPPINLRALQRAGHLVIFRRNEPAWKPPRKRGEAKRGRPPKTGWTGPLLYESIAEELGLATATISPRSRPQAHACELAGPVISRRRRRRA
jgi:hypothetical protein